MIITNQIYVDEMPIFEFETKDLPASLKNITGEARNTIVIGDKTYVKNWLPTEAEEIEMKKGKQIKVKDLEKILPVDGEAVVLK